MNIMKMGMTRSIDRLVEKQVNKWLAQRAKRNRENLSIPVITISRQFGSGGYLVAKQIAGDFGLDLFDREIIQEIADNAHVRRAVVEMLDEKGPDHNKCFEVAAVVRHRHFPSAWGMTKKEAEQKAALNALSELGVLDESGNLPEEQADL